MTEQTADNSSLRTAAKAMGLAFADAVPDAYFSRELAAAVPVAWARAQCLLPVLIDGEPSLLVAVPDDLETQHKASLVAGRRLTPVVATRETILEAIDRFYAGEASAPPSGKDAGNAAENEGDGISAPSAEVNDLLAAGDAAPATKLVNAILLQAVRENASDIHFEPFASKTTVRFRIDGVLYERAAPPKHLEAALVSRLKVMAGMDIAEKRLPQDGMAQVAVGRKSIDIRVSTVPVADGERVVLRLLDRDDACLPMQALGMGDAMLASFRSLMRVPNGIIVVSGPTGSGKTTTLYAALGEIDSSRRNILTIEDPVEYRLPNIGQIQVKPKIGLTFASGLRHILRQDPDVVLVGETRDPETAEIAVRASLTGHLVFTTLHTNDAPSAVMRLVDMGVPPYLLASSLRGVLAQRLVRTLCPACRERIPFADDALPTGFVPDAWREKLAAAGVMAPRGCGKCIGGYRGRQGLFELMVCTPALSALIRRGVADGADLHRAALEAGMSTMADDAFAKLLAGVTDAAEISGALAP